MKGSEELPGLVKLAFYTTAGCHLCEQAALLLEELQRHREISVETIDIADDEALVEKYGIRIPVILNVATQNELGWPFQYQDLLGLL